MPLLHYSLSNRRFFFRTSDGEDTRGMNFDAEYVPQNRWDSFKILRAGGKENAEALNCTLLVEERSDIGVREPSRNGDATNSNDSKQRDGNGFGLISYQEAWEDSETDRKFPAWILIKVLVPASTFLAFLDSDLEQTSIYFSIDTDLLSGGLKYGNAPDGSEKEWDVDEKAHVRAESFSFRLQPIEAKPEPTEPEEPAAMAPSRTPPLLPPEFVVHASRISQLINRLFWAVVAIGVILLLRMIT
jgi:hypothetical protein